MRAATPWPAAARFSCPSNGSKHCRTEAWSRGSMAHPAAPCKHTQPALSNIAACVYTGMGSSVARGGFEARAFSPPVRVHGGPVYSI
jgi:hypothetical protein